MTRPHLWGWPAAIFFVVGLVVCWPSLGYYWNWDDLHLVRTYSSDELWGTVTGPWDPDELETSGLRPLTTVFNHARASVFGEHVALHRVFLVFLFSIYLALIVGAAVRTGTPMLAAVLAGCLTLTAKNSYYHYVWVSDGVHILQALFFALGLHAMLGYLANGGWWRATIAVWLVACALATREDSLAIVPVLVLAGYAFVSGSFRSDESRTPVLSRLVIVTCVLIGIVVLFWGWRRYAVPGAAEFEPDMGALDGFTRTMLWTVGLSGQGSATERTAFRLIAVMAVGALPFVSASERRCALLWLAAALMTTVVGLVEARVNLLVFALTFYPLFLSTVFVALARPRRWGWVAVGLLMIWMNGASIRASRLEQLSLHPLSTDQIYRDWEFTFGAARRATIPEVRRQFLEAKLSGLGIKEANFAFDAWEETIRRTGRRRPSSEGAFVPSRRFLDP